MEKTFIVTLSRSIMKTQVSGISREEVDDKVDKLVKELNLSRGVKDIQKGEFYYLIDIKEVTR